MCCRVADCSGCLLVIAMLFAGLADAGGPDGRITNRVVGVDFRFQAVDSTRSSRQLMQGPGMDNASFSEVFMGGPGLDGGNGGLPTPTPAPTIPGEKTKPDGSTAGPPTGDENASQVFMGGPGLDGGNGGLPDPTLTPTPPGEAGASVVACSSGEYSFNNKCTKCVSKLPSASTDTLRGRKCAKPFSVNGPSSCNFGFLSGLQIGKTESPFEVSSCLDYGKDRVTVYLPRSGFNFFGMTAINYYYDSISLAGAPLLSAPGIPLQYNYMKTINDLKYDALVFTGTSAALSKAKGTNVAINGVLKVEGDFHLCFAATAEVCK